jgi:subtilisin family serine protease
MLKVSDLNPNLLGGQIKLRMESMRKKGQGYSRDSQVKENLRNYVVPILTTIAILLSTAVVLGSTSQPVQAPTENYLDSVALKENLQVAQWWKVWPRDNDCNKIDDVIDHVIENVELAQKKSLSYVISCRHPDIRASLLIDFGREVNDNDIEALSNIAGPSNVHKFRYVNVVSIRNVRPSVVENLSKLENVVMVELQQRVRATLDVSARAVKARPSDVYSDVWEELGVDGTGINIAILDTGVDDEHESLTGKFVAGVDCTGPTDLEFNPDDESAHDIFHGTHVAGIAMGSGGANDKYMGVAPGAGLIDVRVLNKEGEGTSESVIRGIEWCVANKDKYNIRVLNLSLGTDSNSNGGDAQSQAVNEAVEQGLVVIAAVGNDGEDEYITSPAAADGAISVGALFDHNTINRSDDTVASYSNRGPRPDDDDLDPYDELKPDVTAPGTFIWSAKGSNLTATNVYQQLSGTSMATPHVAGVVALMLQANPELTPEEVKEILHDTSEARGVPYSPSLSHKYSTEYGWGIVDAYAAVRSVTENLGPPDFSVSSEDISFSDNTPVENQKILISVTIHNEGEYEGTCDVALYRENGLSFPIGRVVGVRIRGGDTEEVKIEVNCTLQGKHTLTIVIENSGPSEEDISNNQASREITVGIPPVEPDLTLMEYDIRFPMLIISIPRIKSIGSKEGTSGSVQGATLLRPMTRSIMAIIHNVGQTDAICDVKIYYDEKTPKKMIDNFSNVFVGGMSDNRVQTKWIILENIYGDHTVYVVIENSNPLENDLLNNEASRDVSLPTRMTTGDVAISDSDITFSDNEPPAGDEIDVNVTVHNTGVIDVENVNAILYVDNVPTGLETIPLIKQGSENLTSIQWETEEGEHVIEVKVSLEGIDESNYGNNTATSSIFVKEGSLFLLWLVIILAVGVGAGFVTAKIMKR